MQKLIGKLLAPCFSRDEPWLVQDIETGREVEVFIYDEDFWKRLREREYLAFASQTIAFEGIYRPSGAFVAHKVVEWEKCPETEDLNHAGSGQ